MTASQPDSVPTNHPVSHSVDQLGGQLDLLTTIDEFLCSPTTSDQLADFLTDREATGPTGNGMIAACTLIDLFGFTVAALRHQL